MEYREIEDTELFKRLYDADLASKLQGSEDWKLLREACDRIVERTIKKFALDTKVGVASMEDILELQLIIRKYKYGLFDELEMLANEQDFLRSEANERGILGKVANIFKKTAT